MKQFHWRNGRLGPSPSFRGTWRVQHPGPRWPGKQLWSWISGYLQVLRIGRMPWVLFWRCRRLECDRNPGRSGGLETYVPKVGDAFYITLHTVIGVNVLACSQVRATIKADDCILELWLKKKCAGCYSQMGRSIRATLTNSYTAMRATIVFSKVSVPMCSGVEKIER